MCVGEKNMNVFYLGQKLMVCHFGYRHETLVTIYGKTTIIIFSIWKEKWYMFNKIQVLVSTDTQLNSVWPFAEIEELKSMDIHFFGPFFPVVPFIR